MWTAEVKSDVLKFGYEKYENDTGNWVYIEYFWVYATDGSRHFAHFYFYGEDYDTAADTVERIRNAPDFDPSLKPKLWIEIRSPWTQKPPPPVSHKKWWPRLQRALEIRPHEGIPKCDLPSTSSSPPPPS